MPRAIVLVVLGLALLGLGWILWGPKGKAGLDPAEGARFALGREDAPSWSWTSPTTSAPTAKTTP